MEYHNLQEVGRFLQSQRKAQKLSLEKMSEKTGLPTSTLWRIEQGQCRNKEKCHQYAASLGFVLDDLFQKVKKEDITVIRKKLESIENSINIGHKLKEDLELLKEFKLEPQHPYYPLWLYLKAKTFFYMRKYQKSERIAETIIGLEPNKSNIVPLAYNILANIAYSRHELSASLELIEKAIDLFDLEGDRQDNYYVFLMNKVSYLEKLGRLEEGEKAIIEVIANSHKLVKAKNRANSYELYAKLKKNKSPFEALELATQGLYIATENNLPERTIELRTLMGDIYKKLGKIDEARAEYEEALSLLDRIQNKSLCVSAYTSLGYLQLKTGELEQAKYSFSQAVKIGKNKEDSRYLDALIGFSQWHITAGKPNDAIQPLQKALELARHQGANKKQLKIILKLTQCFQTLDQDQFVSYLKLLQKVTLELEDENGY